MYGQMPNTLIICIILGLISWYYFTKLQDSEKEYRKLYKRYDNICMENEKIKSRVEDLQSYKNDVSKTFKILDNELVLINEHLHKRNTPVNIRRPTLDFRNNVSLLTPQMLSSLFNNVNTEESSLPNPFSRTYSSSSLQNLTQNLRQEPEMQEPERQEPERQEPERQEPERQEPERQEPEMQEPEMQEPERQEPEMQEPERQEPEIDNRRGLSIDYMELQNYTSPGPSHGFYNNYQQFLIDKKNPNVE